MTMLQEALLWKTALGYLGPSNLYQVVVHLWRQAGVPARPTVEYLTSDIVGDEVVNILRNAQARVGAMGLAERWRRIHVLCTAVTRASLPAAYWEGCLCVSCR